MSRKYTSRLHLVQADAHVVQPQSLCQSMCPCRAIVVVDQVAGVVWKSQSMELPPCHGGVVIIGMVDVGELPVAQCP